MFILIIRFYIQGSKIPNTATGFDDNDSNIVIAANMEKYSPKLSTEQLNRAITLRDELQTIVENGVELIDLTVLNQLIEQYQTDPVKTMVAYFSFFLVHIYIITIISTISIITSNGF